LNISLRRLLPCLAILLLAVPGLASPPAGPVQPHIAQAKPAGIPVGTRSALLVPSQYPTIQSAINASQDGDTVLVADGTYSGPGNRDIDFNGKSITVTSQNGPASTIINCAGFYAGDGSGNHRGFYIHNNETAVTISGFSVQNGYGFSGGGIYNNGGQLAITNCIISNNRAIYGGGICSNGGSVVLTNSDITLNTGQDAGGGIQADHATIKNCNIVGNKAIYLAVNAFGGGMQVSESTVINCVIRGNESNFAGGIDARYCVVKGCTIIGNTAIENSYGGIFAIEDTITDCVISRNTSQYGSSGIEANGRTTITNCEVTENTGYNEFGGPSSGISCTGDVSVTNCTVVSNATDYGIYFIGNTSITNCILYSDKHIEIYNNPNNVATITVIRSDIQGGYPGIGNIDKDPQFVNAAAGDLHLKPGSPCLGKGTPNGAPATDLDGNPRPNPPSMGAYELGIIPAAIQSFTITPNQVDAPGPKVFADVAVTGNFKSVSITCAPQDFKGLPPTFLLTPGSGHWTATLPTTFLKLAKVNPLTLIATGVRSDGSLAQATATLRVGPLPTLAFSLAPDKTAIQRNETFTLRGYVTNPTTTLAPLRTVQITLPQGINYVSSNGFTYDAFAKTLTSTIPPLLPNGGTYPISIMLQASASAPKRTPLVMPASASCAGFQTATQNPSVVVEAGLVPVGVDVDATGGYGLLDGSAQVHEDLGTPPLYATLSPVSSLNHIWLGVDYVIPANGATVAYSSELSVGSILGRLGLIAPDASPTYDATFPSIGSSVTMGVRLNDAAGVMNIANIFLQAASALAKYGPPPSSKDLLDVYDDIEHVKAFKEALHDLNPPPSGLGHRLVAVAAAVKALADMDDTDTQQLSKIVLKLFGKDVKAKELRRFFKLLGRGETIFNLLQILADETTLVIQTGGDDMVVTFTGSPLHSSGSSASRAVPQEVAIKSKGAKL